MRRHLTLLLLIFAVTRSFGQIVIDETDMPAVGDTLRVSQAVTVPGDYETTGAGMNWDFSMLSGITQAVPSFIDVMTTPPFFRYVFVPGIVANLASPGAYLQSFPGLPFSNYFTFFKNTPGFYSDAGFAFELSGLPIMLKYDSPDINYSFPCTMGKTWSSHSFASVSLPGIAYFGSSRDRTSHVDGWGNLTTPFGTFETIRVRSELIEYDSIFIDTLGLGLPVTRTITEYKWLGKGQGIPLLQINAEGNTATAVYRDKIFQTGISDLRENDLRVFPNPASDVCSISMENVHSPLRLRIVNVFGDVVKEEEAEPGSTGLISLDVSSLAPGCYMIRMTGSGSVHAGKLLIRR